MSAAVHHFGIRHHGPGSARRLLKALQALQPRMLLVEAPADADRLLPALAHVDMHPPIALLAYAVEQPELTSYVPFAAFSPEYQAIRWAMKQGIPVRCIDLPSNIELAQRKADVEIALQPARDSAATTTGEPVEDQAPATDVGEGSEGDAGIARAERIARDPIGELARMAGFEDGESWWHDWLETGDGDAQAVFAAVNRMMTVLRADATVPDLRERQREAHMRLAIAEALRCSDGDIAVVCGAWHVPALQSRHKVADDKMLLRGLPKIAVRQTWVPWTSPRLAAGSGYGAGVDAPRWYAHLWAHGTDASALARWMVQVARVFRAAGGSASPASVIESVRLAQTLASVRGRPSPGYEEMRDAVVACLCGGEPLAWKQHEAELLLGREVGRIPADTALMPLLEDLQRQQKATRLKPEALERELALDLRSDSGSARSVLLHRLSLLEVPWGVQHDAGSSRGTFRERWTLRWEPEFAVRLVEHLVHGTTIAQAASQRSVVRLRDQRAMAELASLINACMEADLPDAVQAGIERLSDVAAHAQECLEMLLALPPLVSLRRYGSARKRGLQQLDGLVERLLAQAALALPYAARNLDDEQGRALCAAMTQWQASLAIAEIAPEQIALWWSALAQLPGDGHVDRRVAGLAARLLHTAGHLDDADMQALLRRMLSTAEDSGHAARFFEGLFDGAASQLLHQRALLDAVDAWVQALDADTFQQQLPLLRRVLAALDGNERRRLLQRVLSPQAASIDGAGLDLRHLDEWTAHAARLQALLAGGVVQWPQ